MVNVELLDKTMAAVEKEAEKKPDASTWNQAHWGILWSEEMKGKLGLTCTSGGCFAGHAVIAAGGKLSYRDMAHVAADGMVMTTTCLMPGETRPEDISEKAQELLGLTYTQASHMFHAHNRVEHLRAMVAALKLDPEADLYEFTPDDYSDEDDLEDDE